MSKIRQIITYGMTTHMSERQIARALSVSRTAVARTLRAFEAYGLRYESIVELPDSRLLQASEGRKGPKPALVTRAGRPVSYHGEELKKERVTLLK